MVGESSSDGQMTPPENATRRVEVNILGERCFIRGSAPEGYIRRLAAMVDEKMREVRRQDPNLVLHRVAILAAIHLADELERERQKVVDLRRQLNERV